MFSQRQRLRRIALHVLLAWVLMLAAGIVNACVLATSTGNDFVNAAHPGSAAAPNPAGCDMHVTLDQGRGAPHRGMAACAKAFNAPSTGAQTLNQKLDPLTAPWLAPAPAPATSPLTSAPEVGPSVVDRDPAPPAIAIRIAFLHLTL